MKKWILGIGLLALVGLAVAGYGFMQIKKPVVTKDAVILLPTGAGLATVKEELKAMDALSDYQYFDLLAGLMNIKKKLRGGKYEIKKGWNKLEVLRIFRSGLSQPVRVTFHNVRTLAAVAGKVAPYIEADSVELLQAMNDPLVWKEAGAEGSVFCHIIPNTYEFFWATSGEEFVHRMVKEAKLYWSEERMQKAAKMNLNPCEIVSLAAIVQEEQSAIPSEQPMIAGLYYNRIKIRMPLQADPTLKYAAGDFSLKRIYNHHKDIESPYNTYKYAGLPPSPIVIPEPGAIDAVLDHVTHNHLYMCAKEDFSGYHYFTSNLREHNNYAIRYRNALSRAKIR